MTSVRHSPHRFGIGLLLVVYVAAWVCSHGISDTNLDSYGDMLENFAWSQAATWGTGKHPPLIAWVTGLWFSVMPRHDIAYHLLAYVNAAVGLLGVWRMTIALGHRDIALPAVLLLSMALPYSTLAVKFNANTILLSAWPWVVWCWARCIASSPGSQDLRALVLGGVTALALLGKYYSGVLLPGLLVASLLRDDGRAWLTTRGPWIAAIAATALLLPHLKWVLDQNFVSLGYVARQGDGRINVGQLIRFALAPLIYWLIPWIVVAWVFTSTSDGTDSRIKRFLNNLVRAWLPAGARDDLFWLVILPWATTMLIGLSGLVTLSLPWAIPIGFGFPLLWLRNLQRISPAPKTLQAAAVKAGLIWLLLIVLLAPVYAWQQSTTGAENYYRPRLEAARALLAAWEQRYPGTSPGWVGGQWAENAIIPFYADPAIRAVRGFPNQHPATVLPHDNWRHEGGLVLCPLGPLSHPYRSDCETAAVSWLADLRQHEPAIEVTVQKSGVRFRKDIPFRYVGYVYLPARP
ncbi:MAG: glycosyltransferase family 39 protein [Proteobacteria bacterium]|nr:glycosyltransferase family 39 protein [Pseudomonadota bacterium]